MKTKVIAKGFAGYVMDVNPSEVYNHPEVKKEIKSLQCYTRARYNYEVKRC